MKKRREVKSFTRLDHDLQEQLKSIPATLIYDFIDYCLSIDKKPTLDEISKRLGFDRHTVAKAKKLLKEKGLLKQEGHKITLFEPKKQNKNNLKKEVNSGDNNTNFSKNSGDNNTNYSVKTNTNYSVKTNTVLDESNYIYKEQKEQKEFQKEKQGEAKAFSPADETSVSTAVSKTPAQLSQNKPVETEIIEADTKALTKPKGNKQICKGLVECLIDDKYIAKGNKDLQNKSYLLFYNAGISTKEQASHVFDELVKLTRSRYGTAEVKYNEAFVEIQARLQRLNSWQALRECYKLTKEVFSIGWDELLKSYLNYKGVESHRLSTGSYVFRENNLCFIDDYLANDVRYPVQSEEICEIIFKYLYMKLTGEGYNINKSQIEAS